MFRQAFVAVLVTSITAGFLAVGAPAPADPTAVPVPVASTFTSLSPVRVLDTRAGSGPVGGGGTITLDLAAWVPAGATSVVLTVTGVSSTAATYVTVFPGGTGRPATSSLNLPAGDTRSNQVTTVLGAGRTVSLYNNAGRVHLVADLAGYYRPGPGARYTALSQGRLLDTRSDNTPVGPGETRTVDLTGRVPASAVAVTFNLTATAVTAPTFVTAWPTGTTRPVASNLTVPPGDTRANQVTVAVGTDARVSLYNNSGRVDLVVDLAGFHTPDYGATFVPLPPKRVLDTRDGTGTGGVTGPLDEVNRTLELGFVDDVPLTATGVALNVTGVAATTGTHVLVWGSQPSRWNSPTTSTLNLSLGQTAANAATVAFDEERHLWFINARGSVHLVADLVGVFVAPAVPCTTDCLYAWGGNQNRKLGTGEAVYTAPTPAQVLLSGVRAADGSSRNGYALRTDGTVWAWGDNSTGQLGNGWTSLWNGGGYHGSGIPVPVLGLTDVTAIAGGEWGAHALRADGTVWAWGDNGSSVPVQVSGLTDAVAIAGGSSATYAVRRDGTVWAWGGAYLGNDPPTSSPVPVQVAGLTDVTAVASNGRGAYVLHADGTVSAWGDNGVGQLGNGQPCAPDTPCLSTVPVPVSGLTGVVGLAGGGDPGYTTANGYALRADGTVWAWGGNLAGALGNGVTCGPATPCESRVPVPVSALRGVTRIAAFGGGGYALRTDGTVWGWGSNGDNALGNTSVVDHTTVPVPVVGLSGVSAIGDGWYAGAAIVPSPQR
ncbi:RCC1 domain-containing protein [Actinophytocola oryzae]|uniref:Alpha-tubulin suppressor-like RCC1 family protein n=1 Tax=Actinophytocola oryzae TaxID=502181 RepID=A0A4R7UZZ2_9PSEU|nr:hypothetical protein [Actinophytocola oryzae]TDV42553.1 alpha-tubulin suppressor-like RCC1 family protein [Actinophytocola oryzae]